MECSLTIEEAKDGKYRISTSPALGVTLFIQITSPTEFTFYFLERTYDIVFSGDRTDVHVIMSLMFTSFLREFETEMSCSLFDIPHPVVPDEIWGRYIVPEQNTLLLGVTSWKQLEKIVSDLIKSLLFWKLLWGQFASCPCEECLRKNGIDDNTCTYELPIEMRHSNNRLLKATSNLNSGSRLRPVWNYFYDMKNEITIIKSNELVTYLEALLILNKRKREIVPGVNGQFILQGEIKNFVTNSYYRELKRIYKALGKTLDTTDIKIIPLENMLVSFSNPYIIALGRLFGLHKFKHEREILRTRHNRESEIIFPVDLYEWQENICAEQFEGMIKALLEREPKIQKARKVSPTFEGDSGRDLLIEWNIVNEASLSENNQPLSVINVIGQCKASNKTVGKSNVTDIRDTIDTHNAQGYFLAVSSQISAAVTKKLEDLQTKGIWTQWWNRDDIELRLSKNQDIIALFPKVVKTRQKVKFVAKTDL
jgi:hypothetical protein